MKKGKRRFLYVIGGIFLLVVIANLGETDTKPVSETDPEPAEVSPAPEEPLPASRWNLTTDSDPITGKTSAYAISPGFNSTEEMEFPYGGTEMSIGFGCNTDSEWLYLYFTEAPNLINNDTKDGYNLSSSRVRWDGTEGTVTLRQTWGGNTLHFVYAPDAIGRIMRHNTMLIELQWYGSGDVYFEASLGGASDAIGQTRNTCSS